MRVLLGWVLAVVAICALALVFAHLVAPPINPQQQAPSGHFGEPCAACHFLRDSVEVQAK